MAGYLGSTPVPSGIKETQSFTATAGQTTFNTLGYSNGNNISVFLNGVRLINGTDYTATNGSDIVLTAAASASDVLDFETFNEFNLVNQNLTTPTFTDTVVVSGDTTATVTLKNNTEEDTDGGRESTLIFQGEQSGGEISTLAEIEASHDGTSDDEKGDLIFRTNDGSDGTSPTEAMRIDSSQNVGIIQDLNIGNNDSSNPVSKLRFGATLYGAADIVPVSTGHKVGLDFKTDSTGDTTIDPVTRMSISNEGFVTIPHQPAFHAKGLANAAASAGNANGNEVLIFNNATTNNGSHYSTSNGRFTAPCSGLFYFSFSLLYDDSFNNTGSAYIRKNGSGIGEFGYIHGSTVDYLQVSGSAVVTMSESDYVDVYTSIAGWHVASETSFTGFMIG